MKNVIVGRLLLDQLFNWLKELDPDADTIIQCWLDDYKISDRAIAEKLGRKQHTFSDQMKKIRTELRKIHTLVSASLRTAPHLHPGSGSSYDWDVERYVRRKQQ